MIIKTLFSNYQETASEKTITKKSLFVFSNQILRTTTSEKVSSVHPFVKKNAIFDIFPNEYYMRTLFYSTTTF